METAVGVFLGLVMGLFLAQGAYTLKRGLDKWHKPAQVREEMKKKMEEARSTQRGGLGDVLAGLLFLTLGTVLAALIFLITLGRL
ncbi:MAG: hypothetical protein FJZ89_00210 [Chloroflexi bacterium]|nr:hypothetical protein [Chloroflexota bacterium]